MFTSRQRTGFSAVLLTLGLVMASASPGAAAEASATAVTGPQARSGPLTNRTQERPPANERDRRRRPAAPSPEAIRQQAQAAATAAGLTCNATEAAALGVTTDTGTAIFEVACDSGPGYIVVTSTPAQTYDCVALAGAAEQARATDPNANVGQQCTLPVNQDTLRVIRQYAAAAGVPCVPDQGSAIAVNRYEVGCTGQDGYWVEHRPDNSWSKAPCWDLATENHICRFSDEGERRGAWRSILASTSASPCDVQHYRRVGRDAQGLILYELKCGAGNGYFVRMDANMQAQRVHTCEEAANIGGGCTLTRMASGGGRP